MESSPTNTVIPQTGSTATSRLDVRHLIAAVLLAASAGPALANGSESAGTDVAIALPLIAGGITLYKDDWKGSFQLGVDTVATVGLAYGLKHIIHEERPDKSDNMSMPSDTAAHRNLKTFWRWGKIGPSGSS